MANDLEPLGREAEAIVRSIGLPPCPAILTKLVREMRAEDPDFTRVGALIGNDLSLAAAVLKTVNSPFYGLRAKATSIRQALALLGLRNVAQLVTGLLLRQAFPVASDRRMEEFWAHSTGIARMAFCLGRHVRGLDGDLAYTFALFRDCGIPAMMGGFTDYEPPYAAKGADDGRSPTEREEESFRIHHAFMGSYLAREWLLPEPVCDAVLRHHDYAAVLGGGTEVSAVIAKLVALGLVAEHVYTKCTTGSSRGEWDRHGADALGHLSMTEADLEELEPELAASLQEG